MSERVVVKGWKKRLGFVFVRCPDCDQVSRLDHSIDENGNVSPSLICPTSWCSFHKNIRLFNWGYGRFPPSVGEGGPA